ncbi:amidohydrolase family protein [Xanthobacter sp. KR7-225]|uniref:amidohydrolase family protein n=1 Tax=Xanthobacter sp. KR7-225 TaxID=3156613 RepID=UPI0032B39E86
MRPVIDSHFHIWRQDDLPWLRGPMVPRIFGPYEDIRRDYLIGEYQADLAGAGVGQAVYVQTNWPKERFEDEVTWVQQTANESGWPHAIVAYADMTADDVRPQLDRLMRYPLVRGVRMQLHWHERPEFRFAEAPDRILDERVRRNLVWLKDYGLSFDLQLFPSQMEAAAGVIGDNPETTFVLVHAGMLADRSDRDAAAWTAGLTKLAALPNVYSKLSGLGTFIHRNDGDLIAYVVATLVELFGSRRLMFGSNFPIEKIWTSYADLIGAHRRAVAQFGGAAEDEVFHGVAARVYRL